MLESNRENHSVNLIVKIWLIVGLLMIFFQIVIGGITRLTGSGLSITEWEIVTGTIPPLSLESWIEEFDKYKLTPQYNKLNVGMELGSIWTPGTFKFIYFWEYLHRLWARTMGFVFLIPFVYFFFKSQIPGRLLRHLGVVILLSILAATFGWIMVASGLIHRPWVNAYKLAIHLSIGISVFIALWWAYLSYSIPDFTPPLERQKQGYWKTVKIILGLLVFQIFIGGIMSGTKAALFFNSWPDYNGSLLPSVILNLSEWNIENFNNYENSSFLVGLIQFIHRTTAYTLLVVCLYVLIKWKPRSMTYLSFAGLLVCQAIIGIVTLIYSKGTIPVFWGVLHQAFAVFTLAAFVAHIYFLSRKTTIGSHN